MLILLTNDDGVYSDGIQTMRQVVEEIPEAEVWVVAPDRERSSSGQSITFHRPLFPQEVHIAGTRPNTHQFSVTGSPADCAKLGIQELLPRQPDIVISGINRGANLGTDVLYSGTVSAAIEGTILGIPAIAVSLCLRGPVDADEYVPAAQFTVGVARQVLKAGMPKGTLLNINVPVLEPQHITGVAYTKMGVRLYRNQFDRRQDPRGKTYYWLGGEVMELYNDPDSDVVAVQNHKISVTPIQLDLTDYSFMDTLKTWQLEG